MTETKRVTIQGFKMVDGKITDETVKKMQEAGNYVGQEVVNLEKMFGEGYKAEKIGEAPKKEKPKVYV